MSEAAADCGDRKHVFGPTDFWRCWRLSFSPPTFCSFSADVCRASFNEIKRKPPRWAASLFAQPHRGEQLLQLRGDAAERGIEFSAYAVHDGNNHDRDAGGDQTIFNGSRSRLILPKPGEKLRHGIAPCGCKKQRCEDRIMRLIGRNFVNSISESEAMDSAFGKHDTPAELCARLFARQHRECLCRDRCSQLRGAAGAVPPFQKIQPSR
jgi:hypothetical protein